MSRLRNLIQEVHRRSLWQVLGIYLVSAWIAYQVIQSLTEGLGLPNWFPALALVLFIIGLPVVLATAFVREDAMRGEGSVERPAAAEPSRVPERAQAPAGAGVRRLLSWRNAVAGGVAALALWGVIAAAWLLFGERTGGTGETAAALDPNIVAVLPFRVAGADPSLEYLREGMLDLLAAKLTGEGGPRAADPRAVMSAWKRIAGLADSDASQEAALEVARALRAGRVLLGGVVGTASKVVLNASLLAVPGGEVGAQASVEGSTDSLTALVDRLTAQLLAREAGEEQRLASLTSTSLPALRAYLDGQATYRRGRYADAEGRFRQALELDSTFALAALGLAAARYWTVNGIDRQSLSVAWPYRARLSERDRALLIALLGPEHPLASAYGAIHAALERAVESAPDRPEAWYWLGESYYHQGPALGIAGSQKLAGDAFGRAFALDSAFSAPLTHLVDLAVMEGDRAAAERQLALYLDVDSTGDFRDYMRWQVAVAFGDSASSSSVRARFPQMSSLVLRAVVRTSALKGLPATDADSAAALLRERPGTAGERWATLLLLHDFELDRGRPAAALAVTDALAGIQPAARQHLRLRVLDALYGGGDPEAATRAVAELVPHASGPLSANVEERAHQYADLCALEQWRLWHGELDSAPRAVARLRGASFSTDSSETVSAAQTCASLIDAIHAVQAGRPGARALVVQLDSALRWIPAGVYEPDRLDRSGGLALAQLLEAEGDLAAALRALQRREFFTSRYLAAYLREEGRLAALVGDREGAIRAYRHYLRLRSEPEPALAGEVERVRRELAQLSGESGGLN
jgi:tetratricopeptide (TPR) repeat protein